MRRLIPLALALAASFATAAPVAAQTPVPRHLHFLTTPSGATHAIAQGLTYEAPCVAFLNFHEIVHTTVFGTPATGTQKNPNGPLAAEVIPELGTCTP